jgi:hypothetical protein
MHLPIYNGRELLLISDGRNDDIITSVTDDDGASIIIIDSIIRYNFTSNMRQQHFTQSNCYYRIDNTLTDSHCNYLLLLCASEIIRQNFVHSPSAFSINIQKKDDYRASEYDCNRSTGNNNQSMMTVST